MISRVSLRTAFAALGLVATVGMIGSASAREVRPIYKPFPVMQLNKAPTTQHANSFARARHGDAISSAATSNLVIQDNTKLGFGKHTLQLNSAPTRQTANSKAVAFGGAALSDASTDNTIIQNNTGGRLQINRAPTTQTARSSALSFGGPAVSSAETSNVVSQGNVR